MSFESGVLLFVLFNCSLNMTTHLTDIYKHHRLIIVLNAWRFSFVCPRIHQILDVLSMIVSDCTVISTLDFGL